MAAGAGGSLLVMESPEDVCAVRLMAESALAGRKAHGDFIAHAQLAGIPIPKRYQFCRPMPPGLQLRTTPGRTADFSRQPRRD